LHLGVNKNMAKKVENTNKSLNALEIKDLINKKTGNKNAYNLLIDNPTEVVGWIPSGNRLFDSNICEGKRAGLPIGRISMYAAESGVGKSFIAIEHCKHAIDMGISPIYFCSEPGGIESDFCLRVLGEERMKKFTYVEVSFMEEIFEIIESLISNTQNKYLFVWDSLAATPSRTETEGGFDPSMFFAVGAKVAALGLKKLMVPLSKSECTFLILNQIRDNIGASKYELMNPMNQYKIPGGKAVVFSCCLVVLLFASTAKTQALLGDDDERIGKHGKAILKKSRFRTEGRTIPIAFTWAGDKPHFHDEELWGEALKDKGYIVTSGPATKIFFKDGSEVRIKMDNWMEHLKDTNFKNKVEELLDEAFIINYKDTKDNLIIKQVPLEEMTEE
jgi:RecA/RadA recombinase